MNVTIITSEYPPEPTVAARMSRDLALRLAEGGHGVRVISPYPSRPYGVDYPESRNARFCKHVSNGVSLLRVPSKQAPRSRLLPRIYESWSFGMWSSRLLAMPDERPDVIYSSTWPMLGQAKVCSIAGALNIPHVMHIMDLYPECALQRLPFWIAAATRQSLLELDRRNAVSATRVLVISESMKETYMQSRGIPPEKISVVHTWQDESLFLELPDRLEAARRFGVNPSYFTFLFLGNIGPVAGVQHLLHSFAEADLAGAQLLIIGGGSDRNKCRQIAEQISARIQFISDHEAENVPLLQSLADVCLLPVRTGAAHYVIPSKLSSYMLSAKPVLASVDHTSETARIIRVAQCGWVINPEDIPALAQKMRELNAADSKWLLQKGINGRTYALNYLSKSRGLQRVTELLLETAGAPAQTSALQEQLADSPL